jgi:Prokaryotic cytochrome b561
VIFFGLGQSAVSRFDGQRSSKAEKTARHATWDPDVVKNRRSPHLTSSDNFPPGSGSSRLGENYPLDQRGCDVCDDHVGLADIRCLSAVRIRDSACCHYRRRSRWLGRRAALAFCGYVVACHQWDQLPHVRYRSWFRRKLLPIRPGEVVRDLRAALTGRLSQGDLLVYNAVQRLLYAGVIAFGIVSALSGIAIWKPVQVQELTAAFGGYETARLVHFFAMAAIVSFLVVHITVAILAPKSLRSIIIGR